MEVTGGQLQRPRLLLIDDDTELSSMLTGLLAEEGYEVTSAFDGQSGLQKALNGTYDVVVLDRGLPFIEGLELLARLRRQGWATPVLVLSAYGTTGDRVAGLDAGAEDYLSKPFDVEEFLARIRALLRRHHDGAELLPVACGLLDLAGRQVRITSGSSPDGVDRTDPVALSAREAELLGVLARRPKWVFTREELRAQVFADAEADTVVDTYVHYLRRKLGRDVVRTVHGVGYQAGAPQR